MFDDPKARRAWSRYRLRVELMLSSVSPSVRRELIGDLAAHVRDAAADGPAHAGELDRVRAALKRLGDPREFLAPLVGDAVFRNAHRDAGPAQAWRAAAIALQRGSRLAWLVILIAGAIALSALFLVVSIGSLAWPDGAGVFRLSAEEIQIRLLPGGSGGARVLWPWLPIGLLAAAALLGGWAMLSGRRIVLEALAETGGEP
jgi:hypothetical protein